MALVVKNLPANAGDLRDASSIPGLGRCHRKAWKPTPAFLPGESHGQRSLVDYSPRGHIESNMTEVTEHTGRQVRDALFLDPGGGSMVVFI